MKQFVDTTGGLWIKGELEDKVEGAESVPDVTVRPPHTDKIRNYW